MNNESNRAASDHKQKTYNSSSHIGASATAISHNISRYRPSISATAFMPASTRRDSAAANYLGAVALTFLALALTLTALNANAQITEDCILEGRVDMRKAEQIGQPMYVRFDKAYRGTEGTCSLNRSSSRRRVKFISNPNLDELDNVTHGARIRYRYVERDGEPGSWELMEVSDRR